MPNIRVHLRIEFTIFQVEYVNYQKFVSTSPSFLEAPAGFFRRENLIFIFCDLDFRTRINTHNFKVKNFNPWSEMWDDNSAL